MNTMNNASLLIRKGQEGLQHVVFSEEELKTFERNIWLFREQYDIDTIKATFKGRNKKWYKNRQFHKMVTHNRNGHLQREFVSGSYVELFIIAWALSDLGITSVVNYKDEIDISNEEGDVVVLDIRRAFETYGADKHLKDDFLRKLGSKPSYSYMCKISNNLNLKISNSIYTTYATELTKIVAEKMVNKFRLYKLQTFIEADIQFKALNDTIVISVTGNDRRRVIVELLRGKFNVQGIMFDDSQTQVHIRE